jgi:hypothetical protein
MTNNQEPENLVVKHNDLNAISYFDSSVQLKIFSRLIVEIRKNPNQKLYSLLIKDVLREINPNSDINKNYTHLKEVAKNMFKVVDIPTEKGFDLRALFISINAKDKSFIHFEVNPSLKPYILRLSKNFTYYFLENIASLNSNFSIRIYELLKQYQDAKTGEGWVNITLNDLKQFLGIKSNQYQQYYNFKTRVILTAQKELGIKTDIKFTFVEEKKTGKKVDRLIFQVLPNKKIADDQLGFDFSGADEANKLLLIKTEIKQEIYGLSESIIDKILEKIITPKDQDNLLGALRAAKNYINQNQGKCNPAAIAQAAIKDGWYLKEEKPQEIITQLPTPKPQLIINNESSFWLQFSSILKANFSEEIFNKWLSFLNFISFENGKLHLATEGEKGKFHRDWVQREYQSQILLHLQNAGVSSITITYLE